MSDNARFPPELKKGISENRGLVQLPACGLHVSAAWFPHASASVCTTEEEEVEIMKYRNLWKRGSFRKWACLTEIPRIMEKWQKGKHGKGIVKQYVTETVFLTKQHRESKEVKWNVLNHDQSFIFIQLIISNLGHKLLRRHFTFI